MFSLEFNLIFLIRMLAAVVCGFGIGLEREITNKYAGLRTHILVCLGSCVFTILSIYGFPLTAEQGNPEAVRDTARVAAQILTGIGFIGGGTVLRHGASVSGLTTAATLWIAASIGMACGTGKLALGLIATIISVGVLVFIRLFERNVLVKSTKNLKRVKLVAYCNEECANNIQNYLIDKFNNIHELSRQIEDKEENISKIIAIIEMGGKNEINNLYKKFQDIQGLKSISIQEHNE